MSRTLESQENLTPSEGIRHNCGIVGIYVNSPDDADVVGNLVASMYSLNHRGQEGAGIAAHNLDGKVMIIKGAGLAKDIFNENGPDDEPKEPKKRIVSLRNHQSNIVLGQDRYSTSGTLDAWQPFSENGVSLVHNGNITNAMELLNKLPIELQAKAVSDTWIVHQFILQQEGKDLAEKITKALPRIEGAYNFLIAGEGKLFACRDPWGLRPFVIGRLENDKGYIVASETVALKVIGASYINEIMPGQAVVVDENGVNNFFLDPRTPTIQQERCIFEQIYFSRADGDVYGQSVTEFRKECGRLLAREDFQNGFIPEVIVPIQQSGYVSAIGYSQEMIRLVGQNWRYRLTALFNPKKASKQMERLTLDLGLYTDRYTGRVFIQPGNRDAGVRGKHHANEVIVSGKKVALIDDSIVRGDTSSPIIEKLKVAGAREVHLRVASPPIRFPCFMGTDFARGEELIANRVHGQSIDQITERVRAHIRADSLRYLNIRQLISAATGQNINQLKDLSDDELLRGYGYCGACFTGCYPDRISSSGEGCFFKR